VTDAVAAFYLREGSGFSACLFIKLNLLFWCSEDYFAQVNMSGHPHEKLVVVLSNHRVGWLAVIVRDLDVLLLEPFADYILGNLEYLDGMGGKSVPK
jgi:hypothetical protein